MRANFTVFLIGATLLLSSAAAGQSLQLQGEISSLKTYVRELNVQTTATVPCQTKACRKFEKRIRKSFDKLYTTPLRSYEAKARRLSDIQSSKFKGIQQDSWLYFQRSVLQPLALHHDSILKICQNYTADAYTRNQACALSEEFKTRILPDILAPYHDVVIRRFKANNSVEMTPDIADKIWHDLTHYPAGRGRASGYSYTQYAPIAGEVIPMSAVFNRDIAPLLKSQKKQIDQSAARATKRAEDARRAEEIRIAAEQARIAREKSESALRLSQCKILQDGVLYVLDDDATSSRGYISVSFTPDSVEKDDLAVGRLDLFTLRAKSTPFNFATGSPKFETADFNGTRPRIPLSRFIEFLGEKVPGMYIDYKVSDERIYRQGKLFDDSQAGFSQELDRGKFTRFYGSITTIGPFLDWLQNPADRRTGAIELQLERNVTWSTRYGEYGEPTYSQGLEVKSAEFKFQKPYSFTESNMREVFRRLKKLKLDGGCTPNP